MLAWETLRASSFELRALGNTVMTRKKPADSAPRETAAILRHWHDAVPNARSLVRALQMRLAEHTVSYGHWTFLRILWETDGLTQRELSTQAGVMEPTTFAAVKAMEALGYVERQQMPDNKKNVHVFLTAEGRALKEKLVPLAEEVNEVGAVGLSEHDIKIARKVLLALIENLADDELGSTNPMRRVPSTRELGRIIAERGDSVEDR
jgi:DNA-binding MarR family transcriptional regulator